jgi:5-methylcytosine-specific restriction endonuclease McrA
MITPIKKPKKAKPISYYRSKCDKAIQEFGRRVYKKCLICGGEYSCLHHFVKKSQSTALRYDWNNLIPICNKCHCSIHQGKDDTVTARIVFLKGQDWFDELMEKKRLGIGKYYGVTWYKDKLKNIDI